jgi:hypothetical protein
MADFRRSPQWDEEWVRGSKIQLEWDTPGLDLTFDWRGIGGFHPDIVLYPEGDAASIEAPITLRLLGYDHSANIYGAGTQTTVYTTDPNRTYFCVYDHESEETIQRPTIQAVR